MKNDYILTLTGAQNWDGDTDTTEMRTDYSLSVEDGGYVIRYEEFAPFGESVTTEFSVRGDTVTLQRGPDEAGRMVFEKGKRHTCWYSTPVGPFAVGICTQSVESELSGDGGFVDLGYTIDINSALRAQNRISIKLRKAERDNECNFKS